MPLQRRINPAGDGFHTPEEYFVDPEDPDYLEEPQPAPR